VLKMFEPMYNLVGFGDPWQFHAVHANSERTNVTILQNSRFGIGDVTFIMLAWGLLEYVVATLKRCSRHTLHLSNGDKLENVTVVLKALGLLGDWSVDKLHNMTQMVGSYCSGDFRRPLMIDATGMNAANFTTFSTGIGTTDFVTSNKYLHDFPKEWYRLEGMGILKTLPRHKEEPDLQKPAYLTDVKFAMTGSIIVDGMIPAMGALKSSFSRYKYTMYHKTHNVDRTLEVAIGEWDAYQKEWKARGIEHDRRVRDLHRGDDLPEAFAVQGEQRASAARPEGADAEPGQGLLHVLQLLAPVQVRLLRGRAAVQEAKHVGARDVPRRLVRAMGGAARGGHVRWPRPRREGGRPLGGDRGGELSLCQAAACRAGW